MAGTTVMDLTANPHFVPKTCPSCKDAVGASVDALVHMGVWGTIDSDTGRIMFLSVGEDDLDCAEFVEITCAHCGARLPITEEEQ